MKALLKMYYKLKFDFLGIRELFLGEDDFLGGEWRPKPLKKVKKAHKIKKNGDFVLGYKRPSKLLIYFELFGIYLLTTTTCSGK